MTPLIIQTSQISRYRGVDAFDITRKSGGEAGEPFAPSRSLLDQALSARDQADRLRKLAEDLFAGTTEDRRLALGQANDLECRTWRTYVPSFVEEMRTSLRVNEKAWRKLLCANGRIVLLCYCDSHLRCHRGLLIELLFRAARKFRREVVWGGEIGVRGDVVSMELPWERVLFMGPKAPGAEDVRGVFQKILSDASELVVSMSPTTIVVATNESSESLSKHVLGEAAKRRLLQDVRAPSLTDIGPLDMTRCARGIAWPAPWQPLSNDLVKRYFEQCKNDLEVRSFGMPTP
jgi:hypothetical protein